MSASDPTGIDWHYDWGLVAAMVGTLAAVAALTAAFSASFALAVRILVFALIGRVRGDLVTATLSFRPQGLPIWLTIGVPVAATIVVFGGLVALDRWRRGLAARRFEARLGDPPAATERTVARLAQRADLPVPELRVFNAAVPTAFTTGLRRDSTSIVVTTGLLDVLDDDQLRAVLAHELSHVKNRDANVMTAAMASVTVAAGLWTASTEDPAPSERTSGSAIREFEGALMAVFGLLAGLYWIVARALVASFARRRELAADRGAAALTGDPAALATALELIDGSRRSEVDLRTAGLEAFAVAPLTGTGQGWSTGWQTPIEWLPTGARRRLEPRFAVHPDTAARVEALRALEHEF